VENARPKSRCTSVSLRADFKCSRRAADFPADRKELLSFCGCPTRRGVPARSGCRFPATQRPNAMAAATAGVVCPGEPLRFAEEFRAGPGTYVRDQHVVAAVVGTARVVPATAEAEDRRPVVEVVRHGTSGASLGTTTERAGGSLIPQVGVEVFARVARVNPRLCNCEILTVNGQAVEDSFSGVIRLQDVRVTETDKIDMYDCFVPGDLVRARILSMGDSRSYYLTTAANELGVVRAKSPFTGEFMIAASWEEMECPSTGQKCKRKVAKVV